jgi:hypothetical protein
MASPTNLTPSLKIRLAVSASGSAKARSNFATQHLQAAEYFSRKNGKLEAEHKDRSLGTFVSEINHLVVATIFLSVASLEANINEYFFDDSDLAQFSKKKDGRSEILRKYQSAMLTLTKEIMDENSLHYRDAEIVILMRNALMHFFPEWRDEQKKHEKLGIRLSGKFPLSPFMPDINPIFPDRAISYGCAQWSVATARNFMQEFILLTGLTARIWKAS